MQLEGYTREHTSINQEISSKRCVNRNVYLYYGQLAGAPRASSVDGDDDVAGVGKSSHVGDDDV